MFTYRQASGVLYRDDEIIGVGYSGAGIGKNNPSQQAAHNVGPIPCGAYLIGELFSSETHGPDCLRLTPAVENEMFGRAGFLMHGDSISHPGAASEGCIIMPHGVRLLVANSGDPDLKVTA